MSLMLRPDLRWNSTLRALRYVEFAHVMGVAGSAVAQARSGAFGRYIEALIDASGAPCRLRDVGVTDNSLSMLARDAMKQTRLLVNNPVEVTEADALSLYREAF